MSTSDDFNLERTLGEGAFGKVYLVTALDDNKQYAMKIIDLRTSPEEERDLAVSEAQLLKDLSHDHVLSYTASFEDKGALCIVTEYCSNGDLSEYLESRCGKQLEEDRLLEWTRQMASALQYMHGKKIIHRDIKTPNIFLTNTWETKLGDLGLAKVLERPNAKAVTFCGSPYYMSPEIFSCKPYDSKSDIWALGVIIYEMATLERPYDAMQMHQLVFKIVHGGLPPMPDGYDPELTDLLSQMMQKAPEKRPTADEILKRKLLQPAKAKIAPLPKRDRDAAGAASGNRWANVIQRAGEERRADCGAGPFDMRKLLDTLSMMRKKDRQRKAQRDEARGAAAGGDSTLKGIGTIMAKNYSPGKGKADLTKTTKNVRIKQLEKKKPVPKVSQASVSDVKLSLRDSSEDFNETLKNIQSKTAGDAFNVMQLIVRTLTGVIPMKTDDKEKEELLKRTHDPEGMMLRQIEHLQYYCTRVLHNDVSLFQRAYDAIANEKDETKLEERLIKILGHERFGLCGVQLMFLKNFEYNLAKLKMVRTEASKDN